jgi:hypothetical protein
VLTAAKIVRVNEISIHVLKGLTQSRMIS